MTSRIDHAAEAERVRKLALDFETEPENNTSATYEESQAVIGAVGNGYALAQVHATLALVEQQRIANLITVADRWTTTESVAPIVCEIKEALGLS